MSDHHKSKPEHISADQLDHPKSKPEILKAEIVAESRLFKVESLHLKFSNGEERVYERMRGGNRGAVMVVPLFDAQTLLLVREYAAGTHSYELGFPKGLIDPGEDAFEAGNRELMEEAGFGARDLIPLKQVSLAPRLFFQPDGHTAGAGSLPRAAGGRRARAPRGDPLAPQSHRRIAGATRLHRVAQHQCPAAGQQMAGGAGKLAQAWVKVIKTEDNKMQELLAWIPGVKEIAREAGRILHEIYHGGQFERQLKEDATPVTSADLAADAYLKQALSALTPPCARADRRGGRCALQPACQLAAILAGGPPRRHRRVHRRQR